MSTHSVHAGERLPIGQGNPTSSPIHIASAYFYDETAELDAAFADSSRGYVYSRFGNPTVTGLETAIATLEGTDTAIAFASGMAAIYAAIVHAVAPGESIVVSQDVYGATYALLKDVLTDSGITPHFVDILDLDTVSSLVRKTNARAILSETASNPLIRVADVSALKSIASEAGAKLIIDNTFLSPAVSRPAILGADYVVHSTTKYLGGHGDSTGGAIATNEGNAAAIRQRLKLTGAILSPFEGWLIHRGIKTLPLRMRQHCANAQIVADWLNSESRIDTVFYPGISQVVPEGVFSGDARGAMVAFEIGTADRDAVFRFLDALTMIIPA
ncbi:MAG: PLP-dependent transferase, partial [Thermomicrobiales bacterium]